MRNIGEKEEWLCEDVRITEFLGGIKLIIRRDTKENK